MLEEIDRVILNLIEFGILDKLFKSYDFTTPNDGIFIWNSRMVEKFKTQKCSWWKHLNFRTSLWLVRSIWHTWVQFYFLILCNTSCYLHWSYLGIYQNFGNSFFFFRKWRFQQEFERRPLLELHLFPLNLLFCFTGYFSLWVGLPQKGSKVNPN